MPVNPLRLRSLYESAVGKDADGRANPGGRHKFVTTVRHWLGLCDADGHNHRDKNGNRLVNMQEAKFAAEDFNMQELAISMIGPAYLQYLNPSDRGSLAGLPGYRQMIDLQFPGDPVAVLEGVGAGVDVSAFADINAWTAVSTGLLERKVLEQFTNPMFIGDQLMATKSTRINEGQKIIGTSRALPITSAGGKATGERLPNQPHPRTTILERYVTLGKGREFANGIDITKEAGFFDLTGELLPTAAAIGEWLGYEKEIQQIDAFIGVTTQSGGLFQFVYKGTATNTYQATNANALGYTSEITGNGPLVDFTNLQTSWATFLRNTDPETLTRINKMPDTVVVNPANLAAGMLTINPNSVQRREAQGLTQATATSLLITEGTNPASMFGANKILWSPLLEQRCTDVDGLNLSQTNASAYWWHFLSGDKGPFKWMQIMPMQVQQAAPTNYDMLDRGIMMSIFADWRAFPASVNPWTVIRNQN